MQSSNWTLLIPVIVLVIQAYSLKSIVLESNWDLCACYHIAEFAVMMMTTFIISKILTALYPDSVGITPKQYNVALETTGKEETPITGTKDVCVQTEHRDYVKEIEIVKAVHERETKRIIRERRILKRRFVERMSKIKKLSVQVDKELSKFQIKIPQLEKEQLELLAEKEAIDKQTEEEKNHYKGLIMKYQRLHTQFIQLGTISTT